MRFSLPILFPLFIVFFVCLALPFLVPSILHRYNIERNVFLCTNLLLLIMSLISFFMQVKGIRHKNPHVFIRRITGGMLIKMVVCIIAVIAYVYYSGPSFSKGFILISLLLYLVYLFTEMALVLKMNRKQHA